MVYNLRSNYDSAPFKCQNNSSKKEKKKGSSKQSCYKSKLVDWYWDYLMPSNSPFRPKDEFPFDANDFQL